MNTRLWGLLVILLIALGSISWLLTRQNAGPDTEELQQPTEEQTKKMTETPKIKQATKEPGRVVVLHTSRGDIEFVLYEKDCPKTTARIAELVQGGSYNGVMFPRAEKWVIQTAPAKKEVTPMGIEIAKGLTHDKGTVGMARTSDPNSNTSVFYITLDPARHLDGQYTNFGRVIRGMDVAMKIKVGDVIKTAQIKPLTDADKQAFNEVLKITAERRTQ